MDFILCITFTQLYLQKLDELSAQNLRRGDVAGERPFAGGSALHALEEVVGGGHYASKKMSTFCSTNGKATQYRVKGWGYVKELEYVTTSTSWKILRENFVRGSDENSTAVMRTKFSTPRVPPRVGIAELRSHSPLLTRNSTDAHSSHQGGS